MHTTDVVPHQESVDPLVVDDVVKSGGEVNDRIHLTKILLRPPPGNPEHGLMRV